MLICTSIYLFLSCSASIHKCKIAYSVGRIVFDGHVTHLSSSVKNFLSHWVGYST